MNVHMCQNVHLARIGNDLWVNPLADPVEKRFSKEIETGYLTALSSRISCQSREAGWKSEDIPIDLDRTPAVTAAIPRSLR